MTLMKIRIKLMLTSGFCGNEREVTFKFPVQQRSYTRLLSSGVNLRLKKTELQKLVNKAEE